MTKMLRAEARKLVGVRSNFTQREVALRCRMMARKDHPDKLNSSAPHSKEVSAEKFKMISSAKDVLISGTHNDNY